jgi:hypothetical protein
MFPGDPAEEEAGAALEVLPLLAPLAEGGNGLAPRDAKFQLDVNMDDVSPS